MTSNTEITEKTYQDLARQIREAGHQNTAADGFCVIVYLDDIDARDFLLHLQSRKGPDDGYRCAQCTRRTDDQGRHLENGSIACPRDPVQEGPS